VFLSLGKSGLTFWLVEMDPLLVGFFGLNDLQGVSSDKDFLEGEFLSPRLRIFFRCGVERMSSIVIDRSRSKISCCVAAAGFAAAALGV